MSVGEPSDDEGDGKKHTTTGTGCYKNFTKSGAGNQSVTDSDSDDYLDDDLNQSITLLPRNNNLEMKPLNLDKAGSIESTDTFISCNTQPFLSIEELSDSRPMSSGGKLKQSNSGDNLKRILRFDRSGRRKLGSVNLPGGLDKPGSSKTLLNSTISGRRKSSACNKSTPAVLAAQVPNKTSSTRQGSSASATALQLPPSIVTAVAVANPPPLLPSGGGGGGGVGSLLQKPILKKLLNLQQSDTSNSHESQSQQQS